MIIPVGLRGVREGHRPGDEWHNLHNSVGSAWFIPVPATDRPSVSLPAAIVGLHLKEILVLLYRSLPPHLYIGKKNIL